MRIRFLCVLLLLAALPLAARDYQKKVFLWEGVPGMETQVRDTVLYVCAGVAAGAPSDSDDSSGTARRGVAAVIICPGGSYHHLGMPHEGFASARWFNSVGVAAFVLRYRVAYNEHHFPAQLEDIQMAIAHVRDHAAEYGIDPARVGAIGYSAGGHLVTMAGEFSARDELSKLGVRTASSLRPDYVMPIYPVVSMQDDIAHRWSRKSLLGHQYKAPGAARGFSLTNIRGFAYSQSLKDEFSMENVANIPADMPPVFLLACEDDPVVPYENSVRLDAALSACGVEHVFASYAEGGHGFGMKPGSAIMRQSHWNDEALLPWLRKIGVVE